MSEVAGETRRHGNGLEGDRQPAYGERSWGKRPAGLFDGHFLLKSGAHSRVESLVSDYFTLRHTSLRTQYTLRKSYSETESSTAKLGNEW